MIKMLSAAFIALSTAASMPALAWSPGEIDAAVKAMKLDDLKGCLAEMKEQLRQDVTLQDFNGDSVYEIVVRSSGDSTACFSMIGHQVDLLIADGRGGWTQHFGHTIDEIVPTGGSSEGWPDVRLTGRGFCFPVYAWHNDQYFLEKTCDNGLPVAHTGKAYGSLVAVLPPNEAAKPNPAVVRGVEATLAPHVAAARPVRAGSDFVDLATLDGIPYRHNGSIVIVDGEKGLIVYAEPKPSLRRLVVPGTVLFRGEPWNMNDPERATIMGEAHVFKGGCAPAAYGVVGHYHNLYGMSQFVLEGAAPVRAKSGCAVVGHSLTSGNARLSFEIAWD